MNWNLRHSLAIFWGLVALIVPYAVMEALHAPTWSFFPTGAVAGFFGLITYLVIKP